MVVLVVDNLITQELMAEHQEQEQQIKVTAEVTVHQLLRVAVKVVVVVAQVRRVQTQQLQHLEQGVMEFRLVLQVHLLLMQVAAAVVL